VAISQREADNPLERSSAPSNILSNAIQKNKYTLREMQEKSSNKANITG
jgi:hypothetical protein